MGLGRGRGDFRGGRGKLVAEEEATVSGLLWGEEGEVGSAVLD